MALYCAHIGWRSFYYGKVRRVVVRGLGDYCFRRESNECALTERTGNARSASEQNSIRRMRQHISRWLFFASAVIQSCGYLAAQTGNISLSSATASPGATVVLGLT